MDRDAIANIDRLTAQVADLHRQLDAKHDKLVEVADKLRGERAQVQRLQESLTACEQERDEYRIQVEIECGEKRNCEWEKAALWERIGLLTETLRRAKANIKPDAIWCLAAIDAALTPAPPATAELCAHGGGNFWTCQRCYDATNHAPPAETPAPFEVEVHEPVSRDASVDAPAPSEQGRSIYFEGERDRDGDPWRQRHAEATTQLITRDREIDRLRAELAAANKEIARLKREVDAAVEYHADFAKRIELALGSDALDDFDGPRLERLEASIGIMRDAHADTTAKLGRAVAFLMKRNYSSPTNNHESFDWYRERDAILADDDGTQAAAAWRELEAVYRTTTAWMKASTVEGNWEAEKAVRAALAAVDARRGTVKP
jgi:hypothetical protein